MDMWKTAYEEMEKLHARHVMPDVTKLALHAIEKQIAKEVTIGEDGDTYCPNCGCRVNPMYHCKHCGQALHPVLEEA